MIVKRGSGYVVTSEDGRNLGGPYPTRAAAEKRLRQVEYFKHKDAEKQRHRSSTHGR